MSAAELFVWAIMMFGVGFAIGLLILIYFGEGEK